MAHFHESLGIGIDLNNLTEDIHGWSEQTFGNARDRGPHGPLKHMVLEIEEALSNPTDVLEYADLLILLADSSRRAGFSFQEVISAAQRKMLINKSRTWARPQPGSMDPALHKRPVIVCLCGSSRFKDAYERSEREEELAGRIVLSLGFFGHLDDGFPMDDEQPGSLKHQIDELHLRKIDLADEVLIINVGGYLGSSTKRELKYAIDQGKTVRFLE